MKRVMCDTEWLISRKELVEMEKDVLEHEREYTEIKHLPPLSSFIDSKRQAASMKRRELEKETEGHLRKTYLPLFVKDCKFSFMKTHLKMEGVETHCMCCKTDFSPLVLLPDSLRQIGTHCLSCSYFLCYRCVLINYLSDDNGYLCPGCQLWNCINTDKKTPPASTTEEEEEHHGQNTIVCCPDSDNEEEEETPSSSSSSFLPRLDEVSSNRKSIHQQQRRRKCSNLSSKYPIVHELFDNNSTEDNDDERLEISTTDNSDGETVKKIFLFI